MKEGVPLPPNTPEQFPSQEDIKSVFTNLLKGKDYKEGKIKTEGDTILLYEIETNEDGKTVEYSYQKISYDYRKESLPSTAKFSATIHKTTYDEDGMPVGGECVANYLDGKWFYLD